MKAEVKDRCRGCLYGLAIGDALGAAVEFKPLGTFPPVTGYRAGGPHGLEAGEWTDDTSMSLALADSLAKVGWDPQDQMTRYLWWRERGEYSVNGTCFDIGNTTSQSLSKFASTGKWKGCSSTSEASSGNGSIMRLAPVAIAYWEPDDFCLYRIAQESSETTHGSLQCKSACKVMACILTWLIRGEGKLSWDKLKWGSETHPSIVEIAEGSFKTKQPPEIKGPGHVVKSLEAALWAFHSSDSFEEAVLKAVNLGDDADTTGAVCGQLAGAFWGESGIPKHLIDDLAKKGMIEKALTGLGVGK